VFVLPDVLERVCAYLEEWVMERDRQGIDPRFSMELHQLRWRYISLFGIEHGWCARILSFQNYVGTGANATPVLSGVAKELLGGTLCVNIS
jgi:hypothetical protein